jgi:8-oxo-dGTP pyrophosphatase MutT (NUDIX family)
MEPRDRLSMHPGENAVAPRISRTLRSDDPEFPAWAAHFVEDGRRAEVLMVARNSDGLVWLHRKGEWRLPTGALERGERPLAGLRREVQEEFGTALPLVATLGVLRIGANALGVHGTFTSYLFLLDGGGHVPQPVADEGIDAWRLETSHGLRLVAASLRALAPRADRFGRNWSFWGAFRATEHDVVANLLASENLGVRYRRRGPRPDQEEEGF